MREPLFRIIDEDTGEVIGALLVDEDELLEAEARAGELGFYLEEVPSWREG